MRRFVQGFASVFVVGMAVVMTGVTLAAQAPRPAPAAPAGAAPRPAGTVTAVGTPGELAVPVDYVIGPDDLLTIVFWKDADMTADVVVRPDGKITLPLLNDVQAAGFTPEQLRERITTAADKFMDGHNVMVRVREIKSRTVTVLGEVRRVGPVPIGNSMTVLQLIGAAEGFTEFADTKNVLIIRNENGKEVTFKFNYNDVSKGKNLRQNIQLKPGDTVIVR